MQRLFKLKKALKASSMNPYAESFRSGRTANRGRALTAQEIEILEGNGNRSDDWSLVSVDTLFTPTRIFDSTFSGKVFLPAFYGTLLMPGDVSSPTGIYSCSIHDSIIENSLLHHVNLMSNIWVSQGAVIQNVGSLVANGKALYQIISEVSVGNEMGGRSVRIFPDITSDLVKLQLFSKADAETDAAFTAQLESWRNEVILPCGIIGKNAIVANTNIVRNSWIGDHVRIDGAAKIRNSVVLGSLEEPTYIYDGVILENSFAQEGAKIHSAALVKDSVLMKRVKAGNKAIINSSIICPCVHIDEAEVTHSFVGPLTQMHHHSLLIAALWPAGHGNLGYGANVGSNHTSRMPDQEIMPGLGMFFGLGVNIKFPANFSEAPYSAIATGVTASPQRLCFPFSLILPGDTHTHNVRSFLNELRPAWCYGKNAYAISRNAYKYKIRGKGFVASEDSQILSDKNAYLVLDALRRLECAQIKEVYTEDDIPGLGSNYLKESARHSAALIYKSFLERYLLTKIVAFAETDRTILGQSPLEARKIFPGDLFKGIVKEISLAETFADLIKRYRTIEKQWSDAVLHGTDRDFVRGRKIFDDYDEAHPADSAFLAYEKARFEDVLRRSAILLRELKVEG